MSSIPDSAGDPVKMVPEENYQARGDGRSRKIARKPGAGWYAWVIPVWKSGAGAGLKSVEPRRIWSYLGLRHMT